MPFKQGESGNPAGRPVGTSNMLTRTVRQTIIDVFNEAQDNPKMASVSLRRFIMKYPRDFYILAARVIPTEIRAELTGSTVNLNFNIANECKPIGTDPDQGNGMHTGILGQQGSLRAEVIPRNIQPGINQVIEDIQPLPVDDRDSLDEY